MKSFTWNGKPKNRCIAKSEAENSAFCMNSANWSCKLRRGEGCHNVQAMLQHHSRRMLMRAMKCKCSVHLA